MHFATGTAVFIAATIGAGYFWNQSINAQKQSLVAQQQLQTELAQTKIFHSRFLAAHAMIQNDEGNFAAAAPLALASYELSPTRAARQQLVRIAENLRQKIEFSASLDIISGTSSRTSTITSATMDGGTFIVGTSEGKIKAWFHRGGEKRFEKKITGSSVSALAISRKRFVIGSSDGSIILVDRNGKEQRRFREGGSYVTALAATDDLLIVASGATAKVWNLNSIGDEPTVLYQDASREPITSLAISADAEFAVIGSANNTARLWSLKAGSKIGEVVANEAVLDVAITPDGKKIAAGTANGSVALFSEAGTNEITLNPLERVTSVALSNNGKFVIAGTDQGFIHLVHLTSGLRRSFSAHSSKIISVSTDPAQPNEFISSSADGTVKVWFLETMEPVATILPGSVIGGKLFLEEDAMQVVETYPSCPSSDKLGFLT